MTQDAIKHIQALRDGLAAELSKDPRVLTLQSLDKTLVELRKILEPNVAVVAPEMSLVARLNALSPSRAASTSQSSPQIARVA